MTDEQTEEIRTLTEEIADLRRSLSDAEKNERKLWADVQAADRLTRGAQHRVLELRAALCLLLLEVEGEYGHDPTLDPTTYAGPKSGLTARAVLGLGIAEEMPESWYKLPPC